jgi:hypothetical protein
MRGFPKSIGCKRDLENLEKDFPAEVKLVLARIEAFDKANPTVIKVVSGSEETKNLVTQTIANPALLSKKLGFKDVAEVTAKIAAVSVEVEKLEVQDGK